MEKRPTGSYRAADIVKSLDYFRSDRSALGASPRYEECLVRAQDQLGKPNPRSLLLVTGATRSPFHSAVLDATFTSLLASARGLMASLWDAARARTLLSDEDLFRECSLRRKSHCPDF